MNSSYGLSLFNKYQQDSKVLKDLLQYLKTYSRATGHSFSYIEAETSLHPDLSLWENIQVEMGPLSMREIQGSLKPDLSALLNLIKNPEMKTREAAAWEKFLISLVKGITGPSQNLLIDLNEDFLSPLIIQQFKKNILQATQSKQVILATANSSLWLDCAHTIVTRKEFKFEIETIGSENLKKHWIA